MLPSFAPPRPLTSSRNEQEKMANAFAFIVKENRSTGMTEKSGNNEKPGISAAWAKIMQKYKMRKQEGSQHCHAKQDSSTEQLTIKVPLRKIDVRSLKQLTKKSQKKGGKKENGEFKQIKCIKKNNDASKTPQIRKIFAEKAPITQANSGKRKKRLPKLERRQFIIYLEEAITPSPFHSQQASKSPWSSFQKNDDELYLCDSEELQQWGSPQGRPRTSKNINKQLKTLNFCVELQESTDQQTQVQESQQKGAAPPSYRPRQNHSAIPQIQVIEDGPSPTSEEAEVQIINPTESYPRQVGKATLKELVCEMRLKHFISQVLYRQFLDNHSFWDIRDFLKKFREGKLHHFDYVRFKFTLLDHRRITELLTNLFPAEYVTGEVGSPFPEVHDFLEKLYDLSGEDYYKLYTKIDNISRVKWWGKILIVQEERLSSCFKEKRVNKRRAERAEQAVLDVINAFRSKKDALGKGSDEDRLNPSKKVKQG